MTTMTTTYTPWGWTKDVVELAEGVWRVTTPSHGGLKLSRERWDELPAAVRDTMMTATFAEEDCEEPIARTLLGVRRRQGPGDGPHRRGVFRPLFPGAPVHTQPPAGPPLPRGGLLGRATSTDPFERFDTRVEAESFTGDAAMVRAYGRMEAIECSATLPLCTGKGARP